METTILKSTKVARSYLTNHATLMEKALHDEDTYIYEFLYLVDKFDKKKHIFKTSTQSLLKYT